MQFTSTRVAASVALAFGILVTTSSHAIRPVPVEGGPQRVTPVVKPLALAKQQITVVVQLAGPSVAEQQGDAGRRFSREEKERAKQQLQAQHDAVRPQIESRGGTVLAHYRAAYNGIKVRIDSDRVAELAALPGVVAVRPLQLYKPDNVNSIPFIGAPDAWARLPVGLHGEGVKIAIIDTGIDYTHANFGGPGTAAAYTAARADTTAPANPAYFGPTAPRVKGGIDLVGDSYDADSSSATYQPIPHPDPNPLDCDGHGSHVAGTAAGSGVLSDGSRYDGPYNASTIASHAWNVGPGVAPKADIYSVRVFGCNGPTDVVVDAIDWAVDHDMDVINMSLGSVFGSKDDPSAVASTNAAKAGVIVIASAGNSGPGSYIAGSPASADGAISVAASDPLASFPGASLSLSTGKTVPTIDANGASIPSGGALTVKVLKDATGNISLGCNADEYVAAGVAGKVAVVRRGTCARVARAIFAQKAGAAAVVMLNTSNGFPPYEGQITSNPDQSAPRDTYVVTIPFLGARLSDRANLLAADGGTTTLAATTLTNPGWKSFASFSSGGPRVGDSHLKPDITAPGVSIASTGIGTGNLNAVLSGTSMAAPHVTGVAALTRQAHPDWNVADIKAAIVGTGDPAKVSGYSTRIGGTGLVQPASSTATQVVARAQGAGQFANALSFGFAEPGRDYSKTKKIVLLNNGSSDAIFNVTRPVFSGSAHSVSLSTGAVRVPARGSAQVSVTLNVAAATAGNSDAFRQVAGLVQFTPASSTDNAGVALRVPYYLVVRPQSDVATSIGMLSGTPPSTTATVSNKHGVIAGSADFYAWGLFSPSLTADVTADDEGDNTNRPSHDVRAVGVQSFPTDQVMQFAVNTYSRWSAASTVELDIYVDVNGDGVDDYLVVGYDFGQLTAGSFDGNYGSFVFSLNPDSTYGSIDYFAFAPTDGSTAILPVDFAQLCPDGPGSTKPDPCLEEGKPFTYHAESRNLLDGSVKTVSGTAKFNPWSPSISTGAFLTVDPGKSATTPIVKNAEWAKTPALGLMVVTQDNKSGSDEAQLIPVQ
jgi:subtilisin family serine protease